MDENGIERVRIGAPLPDPPLFGKRYKRSAGVSGILMTDADVNERSGYVTNDWDVPGGRQLCTLQGYADWSVAIAYAPDGRLLISGAADETVRLWKVGRP